MGRPPHYVNSGRAPCPDRPRREGASREFVRRYSVADVYSKYIRMQKQTTVSKWGNSLAVRIPLKRPGSARATLSPWRCSRTAACPALDSTVL